MTLPTSEIDALLAQLATLSESDTALTKPELALKLKKSFPKADPLAATIALDSFIARREPDNKFGSWGTRGFFTASLVEQASRDVIARYRSCYFDGLTHVLEIGTGTGSDTAALARVSGHVTTIESDPIRAELARHNLAAQGLTNVTILVGDAVSLLGSLDTTSFDGFFADPARRTPSGARVKDAADYSPPLSDLLSVTQARIKAIKVSPGLFFDAPGIGWTRQFVGYGDECLEQTLWCGASVLDSSAYLADLDLGWTPSVECPIPLSPERLEGFLCEAHAVINRSQYLHYFFAERGIAQIAPDVAYGISATPPPPQPFLSAFEIVQAFPFSLSELRTALVSLGWTSRTEIKKRNYVGDIDSLRGSLRLPKHYHEAPFGTIVLFTWRGTPWVVLARRCGE